MKALNTLWEWIKWCVIGIACIVVCYLALYLASGLMGVKMYIKKKVANPLCLSSDVLEMDNRALEKNVRGAFRKEALKFHPDKCSTSRCTEAFTQIVEQRDTLL